MLKHYSKHIHYYAKHLLTTICLLIFVLTANFQSFGIASLEGAPYISSWNTQNTSNDWWQVVDDGVLTVNPEDATFSFADIYYCQSGTDPTPSSLGINLSDQLSAGYSFGYSLGNQTFRYNGGTHEIMLRYDYLYKEKKIIKSPRYF